MKHLLTIEDLSADTMNEILALSREVKALRGKDEQPLKGQTWGLLFSKASTASAPSTSHLVGPLDNSQGTAGATSAVALVVYGRFSCQRTRMLRRSVGPSGSVAASLSESGRGRWAWSARPGRPLIPSIVDPAWSRPSRTGRAAFIAGGRRLVRPAGYGLKGSNRATCVRSRSLTFLVASTRLWTAAVAASRPSTTGTGSGTFSRPHCSATARSTGNSRSS